MQSISEAELRALPIGTLVDSGSTVYVLEARTKTHVTLATTKPRPGLPIAERGAVESARNAHNQTNMPFVGGRIMLNAPIDPLKLPKTLRKLAARIIDFEDDRNNQNGYWVHLAAGWQDSFNPTCHTIHEDTLAECAQCVRDAIPCDCADCKPGERAQ